ncbi:hypothetical protein J3F83DRAFT_717126 [Trichoderma novae-zelandiae]
MDGTQPSRSRDAHRTSHQPEAEHHCSRRGARPQDSQPQVGQVWTVFHPQQIVQLSAAPKGAMLKAVQWLRQGGINGKPIKSTAGRNWLKFNTAVAVAGKLLDTIYYTYRNGDEGVELIACWSYSVPHDIWSNIALIMLTI